MGMRFLLTAMMAMSVVGAPSSRADWPNFRGPNYDGISREKGLRYEYSEPLKMVWDRTVGSSFSSFACVGDRVYTCGTKDDQQVLLSLNADTGKVIWQKAIGKAYPDASGGDGTRATPTVDGNRVYILEAWGTLLCLSADKGEELWREKYDEKPMWGYSGSVLIEGDLAIVSAGASSGTLRALDKKTGKLVWKSGDDPVGYATPYPFTFQGKRYIVGFNAKSALIVEATTGRIVWRDLWRTDWGVNAASPIFHDGYLYLSSGYRTGAAVFKMSVEGDKLAGEQVWKSRVLMNKFQSCILYEGKLYASDQKALVCADLLTGKELWRKHRVKHGTIVLAEGYLILLDQHGTLQIAQASPEGFEPVTTAKILSDRCWTVPVIHRGRLYARDLGRIVCFDLKR
jgi:outer membrane protein assembly factor BamB